MGGVNRPFHGAFVESSDCGDIENEGRIVERDEELTYAAPYPVSVSPFIFGGSRIKSPLAPCILSKYHGGIVSVAPPSGMKIWSNPPLRAVSSAGVGSQIPPVGVGAYTTQEQAEEMREAWLAHWDVNGGGLAVGIGAFGVRVNVWQKDVAAARRFSKAR